MYDLNEGYKNKRLSDVKGNLLVQQKIESCIKLSVETLVSCYGRSSRVMVDAYTKELANSDYTPDEIEASIKDLVNTQEKFPSLAEVKSCINGKFPKKTHTAKVNDRAWEQALADGVAYTKQKKEFLKKFSQEDLTRWTMYYCHHVFGPEVIAKEYIRLYEQISLKDLINSNMDKDRAIERGRTLN